MSLSIASSRPSAPFVPSAARAGRAVGAMFFAGFGTAWLAWAVIIAGRAVAAWLPCIVLAGAAIFALALRRFRANRAAKAAAASDPRGRRMARVFHIVNAAQWVLILVTTNVLNNLGLGAWDVAAIAFIVGLHFLPLAAVFAYRWHYVTGTALIVLAVAAGTSGFAVTLGAGLILWMSALNALRPDAAGEAAAIR